MNESLDYVTGVHIFPIKSCHEATAQGEPLTSLAVGQTGFEHNQVADREFVIVDATDRYVSQRGWNEKNAVRYAGDRVLATVQVDIGTEALAVTAPGHGEITLPIDVQHTDSRPVEIFGPKLQATDAGPEPARFFSELLGRAVCLVRADRERPRMLNEGYQRAGAANQSMGADGRPFSLASQESLHYLHDALGWPRGTLPLNRYRSNIEISGTALGPFGEDRVIQWQIGRMAAYGIKALERCPMPNIDQGSGVADKLSTKLLGRTRMGWAIGADTTQRARPFFGQSLNHIVPTDQEDRVISVGDPVTVATAGSPNIILKDDMHR